MERRGPNGSDDGRVRDPPAVRSTDGLPLGATTLGSALGVGVGQ